jgi:hypothetical protein
MVLFGNLEISDIENLPSDTFREVVRYALQAGTQGKGRGFVLMPSASPCSREISDLTWQNYRIIIEEVQNFSSNT